MTDTHAVIAGEPMEGHMTQDTRIFNVTDYANGNVAAKVGDVLSLYPETAGNLSSGILCNLIMSMKPGFAQEILNSYNGYWIGLLMVDRPSPDPDSRFESLIVESLYDGTPEGLRDQVDPALLIPTPTQGCASDQCLQIIPSADVFYFGPEPTNTACLSNVTSQPPPPPTPALDMDPSYVYVVYQPYQLFDMCRNWLGGMQAPATTIKYESTAISTLQYQSGAPPMTKVMNFADLPCPPTGVADQVNSGAPYNPILVPKIYPLVEGAMECHAVAIKDPPVRAIRVNKISGPDDGGGGIP